MRHPTDEIGADRVCPHTGETFEGCWSHREMFDTCTHCDDGTKVGARYEILKRYGLYEIWPTGMNPAKVHRDVMPVARFERLAPAEHWMAELEQIVSNAELDVRSASAGPCPPPYAG